MMRLLIIVPLAVLLCVGPILASTVACACCYDVQEDVSASLREHAVAEASDRSGDGGHHHGPAHHEHGADEASGLDIATSAHAGASAPNSCSCDQADDPAAQPVAISQVSKSSRKSTEIAPRPFVSAFTAGEDRVYPGTCSVEVGGVPVPAPRVYLLNRALLI